MSIDHDLSSSPSDLGWSPFFQEQLVHLPQHLVVGRVALAQRGHYQLLGERGPFAAELGGRLRHHAEGTLDLPAVGDWVAVSPGTSGGPALVQHVLERRTALVRGKGAAGRAQILVANVDVVGIVTSLNEDFNLRRLERYLAMVIEGGAEPLLVLSKSDLCEAPERFEVAAAGVAGAAPVLRVSCARGEGVEALRAWTGRGRTLALVGSSGVGKSTLINALLGRDERAVGAIREHDGRGRHVTTHREICPMPGGGLLVDTPGLREVALAADVDGPVAGFDEIEALAGGCRFRDCRHEDEPGCAVLGAVREGALDAARLASHHKLERERAHQRRQHDPAERAAERQRWKQIAKSQRAHGKGR
jgi:ribosome biogenesis GTPase